MFSLEEAPYYSDHWSPDNGHPVSRMVGNEYGSVAYNMLAEMFTKTNKMHKKTLPVND